MHACLINTVHHAKSALFLGIELQVGLITAIITNL